MIKNPIELIARYPNSSLLILIAVSGAVADFLYSTYSGMGQVILSISPGEIIRGGAFIVLLRMMIIGKLQIPRTLSLFLLTFLIVSLHYAFVGEEAIMTRQEMRIFVFIKILNLILMTALVWRVMQRNELRAQALIKILTVWVILFHAFPIILSYFGIIGYSSSYHRIENVGLIFSINASSIILLASYPFMVIPSSITGIMTSLTGFTACEMLGTKAAAVGGLIIPLILLLIAFLYRARFYVKTTIFIMFMFIIIFINKDLILGVPETNLEIYKQLYYQSADLFMVLTSGRSDYYYQLPNFIEKNNLLELLMGSPILCFNEMDHLMMLSRFGILGIAVYFFIVWKAIMIGISLMKKGWLQSQIALSIFALITHSIFGGHVIGGTVSSFPVAMVVGMAIFFSNAANVPVDQTVPTEKRK